MWVISPSVKKCNDEKTVCAVADLQAQEVWYSYEGNLLPVYKGATVYADINIIIADKVFPVDSIIITVKTPDGKVVSDTITDVTQTGIITKVVKTEQFTVEKSGNVVININVVSEKEGTVVITLALPVIVKTPPSPPSTTVKLRLSANLEVGGVTYSSNYTGTVTVHDGDTVRVNCTVYSNKQVKATLVVSATNYVYTKDITVNGYASIQLSVPADKLVSEDILCVKLIYNDYVDPKNIFCWDIHKSSSGGSGGNNSGSGSGSDEGGGSGGNSLFNYQVTPADAALLGVLAGLVFIVFSMKR